MVPAEPGDDCLPAQRFVQRECQPTPILTAVGQEHVMGTGREEREVPKHCLSPYVGGDGNFGTFTAGACWPVMMAIRRSPSGVGCIKILCFVPTKPFCSSS